MELLRPLLMSLVSELVNLPLEEGVLRLGEEITELRHLPLKIDPWQHNLVHLQHLQQGSFKHSFFALR